jgi:light-regulated signal transduction histidine kinase (bacteriophytochrome)
MRIVLDNLLGNAFKYTTGCEHARIGLSATERNAERVYCVADNGVGFDMQYAGRLFGAFQRLHASSRFDGLGIGLATVQRIVHRHGGRVWAEAAPEQGARFYFTLGVESCADRGGGPARLN